MTSASSADEGATSPLAQLFTAYAGLQVLLALASLVRNKVTATSLGPGGYGEFAQLVNVNALLVAGASLGMGVALGRNLAVTEDQADRQRILSTAFNLTLVLSTIFCAASLALVWSGDFLRLIGVPDSTPTRIAAAVTVVSVPIISLQGLYIAALQGLLDASGIARFRGIAVALATAVGVPIIFIWGIIGASIAALLLAAFTGIALAARLRHLGLRPFGLAWSRSAMASLLALGIASTVSSIAHSGADVVTRAMTIAQLGAHANGLLQAPLSVTALAQSVLLGSIGALSVAVIARTRGASQVRAELVRMIDFLLPFAALGFTVLGALASLILRLLFSSEFVEAHELFLPVNLYQFTVVLYWIIGSPLLAAGRAGLWLALDLIGAIAKVSFTWLLLPHFELIGVPLALLLFGLLHLILSVTALRFALGVSLPWRVWLLSSVGALAIALGALLPRMGVVGDGLAGTIVALLSVACYRTYRLHR